MRAPRSTRALALSALLVALCAFSGDGKPLTQFAARPAQGWNEPQLVRAHAAMTAFVVTSNAKTYCLRVFAVEGCRCMLTRKILHTA